MYNMTGTPTSGVITLMGITPPPDASITLSHAHAIVTEAPKKTQAGIRIT